MTILRSLCLSILLPGLLAAQPGVIALPANDPVMARLDELAALPWIKHSAFSTDTAKLNVHGFGAAVVPTWPEATTQHRIAVLDGNTPFNLIYNPVVQSYIDLYTVRKREMSSRMLGLAELYFPVFEEQLDRHGIPQEMKYLAVVESALNPAARSRAGAVGLWQFMLPTGKMFGLKADSYIDERHDVYKSTEAACRYLKYLHSLYNNWEMALAAYNCGPGNVNKAIRRSGGEMDYWKIYDHLPRETRGYVPAFIAVNYLFAHNADHNIYPVAPTYCAYEVDTVQVCYPLDLAAIAVLSGGTVQELKDLNPTFKLGIVPDVEQSVSIYLPKSTVPVFISNEEVLRYSYQAATPTRNAPQVAIASSQERPAVKHHTVRRGESLGGIANKYGVPLSELKRMNHLRGNTIHPGQKLVVRKGTAPAPERTATADPGSRNATDYYVVQPGDTLWGIAQRHPGVSVEDLRRLNGGLPEGLKPGAKIIVRVPQG